MGKVDRLCNKFELFRCPVWSSRHCTCQTPNPARGLGITPPQYRQYYDSYKDMLGSILKEDAFPLFLSKYVIYLCVHAMIAS